MNRLDDWSTLCGSVASFLAIVFLAHGAFARDAMIMFGTDFPADGGRIICENWYNHRSNVDGWSAKGSYITMTHLIADASKTSYGNDSSYADSADAVFVCEHGSPASPDTLFVATLSSPAYPIGFRFQG